MFIPSFVWICCAILIFLFQSNGQVLGDIQISKNNGCCAQELNLLGYSQLTFSMVPHKANKSSEFPPDLFSKDALKKGAVILHFIGALYSFGIIGIVCGDYFLPSIDCICCDLNLSQDVAAATFMSFATTAPELFVILIATFITKSDIGIGAVVGSGMFNILGVATVGGLAAASPIKLDWWPLYRDSLVYMFAPIILAIVVSDGFVSLPEALSLIFYYLIYFLIMLFNRKIRKKVKICFKKIKRAKKLPDDSKNSISQNNVPTISLTLDHSINNGQQSNSLTLNNETQSEQEKNDEYEGSFKAYFINYEDSISLRRISASSTGSNRSNKSQKVANLNISERKSSFVVERNYNQLQVCENLHFAVPSLPDSLSEKKGTVNSELCSSSNTQVYPTYNNEEYLKPNFFTLPSSSCWDKFVWVILWPSSFILYCTIPNCRLNRWRKYYLLTFIMCVVWIGSASYFGTWMISVLGKTIGISDSVMGLTLLALGGSMPEAISTFIMARQGEGGVGFSNSLGGNTMDICLCLGLPWLIKCAIHGPVEIQSEGIQYNSIALLFGVIVLLSVVTHTKFHMNKKLGIVCCAFYLIFIVISVLIELCIIPIEPNG